MSHARSGDFNAFVAGLDYPMFIVTAAAHGRRGGCLVGFTTQTSIDPPRMLVCLSVENYTYRVALESELLAVHMMDPDQRDLAKLFGGETGDDLDKFARCQWSEGQDCLPLLDDCPRRFIGRILERHPLGDHCGFLLEPTRVDVGESGSGLSFEQAKGIDPGHRA